LELVRTTLDRSGMMPLTLNLRGFTRVWEDLLHYLVELAPRWEHLAFDLRNYDEGAKAVLRRTFSRLDSLPSLKSMDVTGDLIPISLQPDTPNLSTLRLKNVWIDDMIRFLRMDCCKRLTSLSMSNLYGVQEYDREGFDLIHISLPYLHSLDIRDSSGDKMIHFLPRFATHFVLPSVLSLKLYARGSYREGSLVSRVVDFIRATRCGTSLTTFYAAYIQDVIPILRLTPQLKSLQYHDCVWNHPLGSFISSMSLDSGVESKPIVPLLQHLKLEVSPSVVPNFNFEKFSDMIRSRWTPEGFDGSLEKVDLTMPSTGFKDELMSNKGYSAIMAMKEEGLGFEIDWK
jgi:hypothetical protein